MLYIPSKRGKKPLKKQFFPCRNILATALKKGGPPSFGHPVYFKELNERLVIIIITNTYKKYLKTLCTVCHIYTFYKNPRIQHISFRAAISRNYGLTFRSGD